MDKFEEVKAFELKVGETIAVILDEHNLFTFIIRRIDKETDLCVIETDKDLRLRFPLGKLVYKLG
jgi:hypothetical protein